MRRISVWAFAALILLGVSSANAQVVISQVYGGGGNSGATFTNDFIELFNRGNTTVDMTGWSVQYASSGGSSWLVTPIQGTLAPGQYYLVQQAQGSGGTTALPAPDATGVTAMSASSGKVALVSSTTALSGTCPAGGYEDLVGFGSSASCFEGSDQTPTLSNTTAAHRAGNGCTDSNDNAADFSAAAPAPRNTASPLNTCAAGGETNPAATGTATPDSVLAGEMSLLAVEVSPGTNPASTAIVVVADLTSIGGVDAQPFVLDGDDVYTFHAVISPDTLPGDKVLPVTVSDAQGRSGSTTIALRVQAPFVPADHVVISQVYGGGGNGGAQYNRDFVELYNPTTETVDLAGWTLQYASSTGSVSGSNNTVQPIGGLIGPGEYFLVSMAAGAGNGVDLPEANVLGGTSLSSSSGKIALVSNGSLIVGDCPLSDPDIIDYVGYGSANCSEGGETAPGLSNSTAAIRGNGGSLDTDHNRDDFSSGAPAPRRTAPIMEIGPAVMSTDPAQNGFNAPRDASITVTFTENVIVSNAWFAVSCEVTGAHAEVTVAGGGRTYVITPNQNFQAGEICSVIVYASQVYDEDLDDAGPNTDYLAIDHAWTFSVATGAPPPYADHVHLTMGNPSGAVVDIDIPNNYLMAKPEFALSYNRDRGTPNWVSWHLSDEWVGSLSRFDTFRPDPAVLPEWYRVQGFDYSGSGFNRGHVVPSADRDHESSIPINQATFLMTNMIPQSPDNNQGPWANLENYLRTLLDGNELYIVAGGAGTGGVGENGAADYIAEGHVAVPSYTWKAALVLPKLDGNDVERVAAATRTIAVVMPNVQGIRTENREDWREYLTTVDAVEALTGYDLFSEVRTAIQNSIEAGVDGENPPGAADQSIGVREDDFSTFTLDAVGANEAPLTVVMVVEPSHGALSGDGLSMTYTPASDYFGEDAFAYRVSDGTAMSNVAEVTMVVMEVNDVPIAGNDAASMNDNSTLTFPASDLLVNDVAGPSNESDQVLSVVEVLATAGTDGVVSLDGGSVSYTPEPDFSGTSSFEYRVCDDGVSEGQADPLCSTGVVNVTVYDTTAPVISDLQLSRTSLWPVNHQLISVGVSYTVTDSGDPAPICSLTVISDEPDNGEGDGDTIGDIEVVSEFEVRLRSERAGAGDGRVYTVTVGCQDASGNSSQKSASVTVAR